MVDYSHAEASSLPGADRLNTQEAARELGVSKATLLRWIKSGKIKDVKRDRNTWRVFSPEDIREIREKMGLTV